MAKQLLEMTLEELWQLFPIVLTEHQECWKQWYEDELKVLLPLLPKSARVNHIGSTAVEGIWAKPIVDILVELQRPGEEAVEEKPAEHPAYGIAEVAGMLSQNGYILMSMSDDRKRASLNKGYTPEGFAESVFHIHLRYAGDNDELYFLRYLNRHKETAKEYERLKLGLWKPFEHDRDGYTAAKSDFIREVTARAKAECIDGAAYIDEAAGGAGRASADGATGEAEAVCIGGTAGETGGVNTGENITGNCTVLEYYRSNSGLEIRDLFKFIYQSAFGCEHLVSDYDRALQWIMSESETAETDDLPDIEFLDGEYCRVHLKCLSSSVKKEKLCRLFLQSSCSHPEGQERLECMLEELKEYLPFDETCFTREQLLNEIEAWKSAGYPPIHHSDSFRDAHHPAYRVIRKEYLRELQVFIGS